MSNPQDDTLNIQPKPAGHGQSSQPADSARQRIAELSDYHPVRPDFMGMLGHSISYVAQSIESAVEIVPPETPPAAAPEAKPHPGHRHKVNKWRPILNAVLFFAAVFALFKAPVFISQLRYKFNPPKTVAPVVTPATQNQEAKLTVPKINVSAPIIFEPSLAEPAIQNSLRNGVVHYATTARPGEPGNSVIVGHSSNDWWEPGNYKFVFVLLDKLVAGDKIHVSYQGKYYVYEVYESKVVEPTDLSVLAQSPSHELTLLTCTPPGTSWKRLIVKAKQVSPQPKGTEQTARSSGRQDNLLLPGNAPGISDQLARFWRNFTQIFNTES